MKDSRPQILSECSMRESQSKSENWMAAANLRASLLFTLVCFFLIGCVSTNSPHPVPWVPEVLAVPAEKPLPSPSGPHSGPVIATRLFTGRNQYPPDPFAAYGIVVFKRIATTDATAKRQMMICEAYTEAIPHESETDTPRSKQIVTAWPVLDDALAFRLNQAGRGTVCEVAVKQYDLVTARDALNRASRTGVRMRGRGPYLLAWSPSVVMGQPDALVLVADLSTVTTPGQAAEVFDAWRNDIEMDPMLWENGWDLDRVRLKIQQWADLFGKDLITMFIK